MSDMHRNLALAVGLTLAFMSIFSAVFKVQQVKAADEIIYIKADGSVVPSTAPIEKVGNVYIFKGNITNQRIVVEKDNVVIDGVGYVLDGADLGGGAGINLTGRSQVTIKNLEIRKFGWGIYLLNSSNNVISGNIVKNGAFGIFLNSSSNYNSIRENVIETNTDHAIELDFSSNNNITRNTITNNRYSGILLRYNSSFNNICENNLTTNRYGIQLNHFCCNNTIARNNVTGSEFGAVMLYYSSDYNSVYENNLYYNGRGISLTESSNNVIYHNNFIGNSQQAYVAMLGYANTWDNGYPSGGNYWSDYTGVDADRDGIGDTPYVINQDNVDMYPLVVPLIPTPIPSPTPTPTQTPRDSFPTWIIGVAIIIVSVIIAIMLLEKPKRRRRFRKS